MQKGGLCRELESLKDIVDRGLAQTAPLWPGVRIGFGFVHQAARILGHRQRQRGRVVRGHYRRLLQRIRRKAKGDTPLATALQHFLKVTTSYWPGLFHCYDVPDLPRTNNALEQLFGSTRHHERRCTGRKVASPSLVLRGSVRITAGLGTRHRSFQGPELAPPKLAAWRTLRAGLDERRHARTLRRRFRQNPTAYLGDLEVLLLKHTLPP